MSTKSTGGSGGNKPDVIDSVAGSSNDAIAKDNGDAAGDAAEAAQRLEQAEEHRKREAEQKSAAFAVVLAPSYITTTRMAPLMTFNAVPAKELASPLHSGGIFAVNAIPAHNCTLCWAQEHETAFVPALRNFTNIGVKSSTFRPPLPLETPFSPLTAFLTRSMSRLRTSLIFRNKSGNF